MDGILIFNKPKSITSHDVVYIVRKKLGIKKVGHTGTLDPIATGVLPILIGKGTKLSSRLINDSKEYIAEFEFGYQTDSLDITGSVTSKTNNIPTKLELLNTLKEFDGEIEQIPPIYSAIKIKGKKLYEYARAGETVEIPSRKCTIYKIEFLSYVNGKCSILVNCSSGTYIRALIRDIAIKLNSLATMTNLVRTKVDNFIIENSIDKVLFEESSIEELKKKIIPLDIALNLKKIELPKSEYIKINNGMICKTDIIYDKDLEYNIYCDNKYIGIGKYLFHNNIWGIKIVKMLNN